MMASFEDKGDEVMDVDMLKRRQALVEELQWLVTRTRPDIVYQNGLIANCQLKLQSKVLHALVRSVDHPEPFGAKDSIRRCRQAGWTFLRMCPSSTT